MPHFMWHLLWIFLQPIAKNWENQYLLKISNMLCEICVPERNFVQEYMLIVPFHCQRSDSELMSLERTRIWKKLYFLISKCIVQKISALPGHCLYWIRQAHAPEHTILSPCQVHHDCARWWDKDSTRLHLKGIIGCEGRFVSSAARPGVLVD